MKDITIAVPFVIQAIEGARHAGYDVKRLLKEAGISPSLLHQPRARVALEPFVRLVQNLMRTMDDEAVGLLEKPQRLGTFLLVARSVLHETDLRGAIRCHARAYNLLDSGFVHFVEEQPQRVIYGLRRRNAQSIRSDYIIESATMTLHRFLCWLCRARIPLLQVELDYAAPPWVDEYRYLFYGAPVLFSRREIRLELRPADMELRVKQDVFSLAEYFARAPMDIFAPTSNASLAFRAREEILRSLRAGQGVPKASAVAEGLQMGPQTMWRRLREEGTDFTTLRTQARRDMAIWMLSQPEGRSVDDIAEAVGFSESSAFVRAFRHWTGMTPLRYRKL